MEKYLRGQLAKAANINREALRYYENSGLIPKAERDTNGYRAYPSQTLVLLDFITTAKSAGFTLKEIKGIFAALEGPDIDRMHLESMIEEKLTEIEEKKKALDITRENLLDIKDHLDHPQDCPVFNAYQALLNKSGHQA